MFPAFSSSTEAVCRHPRFLHGNLQREDALGGRNHGAIRPGQSILFSQPGHHPRPAFPVAPRRPGQACPGRCRAAYTTSPSTCGWGRRPMAAGTAMTLTAEQRRAAVRPARFCARVLHAGTRHRGRLQGRRFLCAGERQRSHLERPDARDRLAAPARQAVLVGQGSQARPFRGFRVSIQVRRHDVQAHSRHGRRGLHRLCGRSAHHPRDRPRVLVVDKLTYAGNLDSLAPVSNDPRYLFCARISPIRRRCAMRSKPFSRTP